MYNKFYHCDSFKNKKQHFQKTCVYKISYDYEGTKQNKTEKQNKTDLFCDRFVLFSKVRKIVLLMF